MRPKIVVVVLIALELTACSWVRRKLHHRAARVASLDRFDPANVDGVDLELGGIRLSNPTAFIPAQCYTKTRDEAGRVHNPCYTCHQESASPNLANDARLQVAYAFPGPAGTNPWTNLFEDRARAVAAIGDDEILRYVRESNYFAADGSLVLRDRLRNVPSGWDVDDDGTWGGYVPDAYFHFDERGFDHAPDGSETGWRTFAYYPFLGTFFPTNGSTDDVLIRLPSEYRTREDGTADRLVYETNLAIVEATVKRRDVAIDATDETLVDRDLDRDGRLGVATRVVYAWDGARDIRMAFVGAADRAQRDGTVLAYPGMFPAGTEFLHSVRYLDVADDGHVGMSARMKELRYARKLRLYTLGELEQRALLEAREIAEDPDAAEEFRGSAEAGLSNRIGWVYQGFIEDRAGTLRPQTFEEHVACIGCHSGIGATTDGIFAFPRRLGHDEFQSGWFHPTDHSLAGVGDPTRTDGHGEYAFYLETNGAGDELRGNDEVRAHFFAPDGTPDARAMAQLADDIGVLLYPSRERAIALDKAYLALVRAQSFRRGRDATVRPQTNVLRAIDAQDASTGITATVAGPGVLTARVRPASP